MRGIIYRSPGTRARVSNSLALRGGLAHTFGGLAAFVAVTFLSAGLYILQDALADPINETAVAVIVAALMIAVATIMFFFLLKPLKGARPRNRAPNGVTRVSSTLPALDVAPNLARQRHSRNLPYQRIYVDHSFIRP